MGRNFQAVFRLLTCLFILGTLGTLIAYNRRGDAIEATVKSFYRGQSFESIEHTLQDQRIVFEAGKNGEDRPSLVIKDASFWMRPSSSDEYNLQFDQDRNLDSIVIQATPPSTDLRSKKIL